MEVLSTNSSSFRRHQIHLCNHHHRQNLIDHATTVNLKIRSLLHKLSSVNFFKTNRHSSSLHPSVDPRHVLAGNFAPVTECSPVSCPITKGTIPPSLRGGAYIRNGPNPQYFPDETTPHHLFDGDGMLHSILLPSDGDDSPATFCSRFVRTNKYVTERDVKARIFLNVIAGNHGLSGIGQTALFILRAFVIGSIDISRGIGLANTSLIHFSDQLLALAESDLPYAVHLSPLNGDIITIGQHDFDGDLLVNMTAHPKKDPDTGELFGYKCNPVRPFVSYFWFDRNGKKQREVEISSVDRSSIMHDFMVTRNHALFFDTEIVIKPSNILLGRGSIIEHDPNKIPRIGVLPRYPETGDETRWFDAPGFNPGHLVNAWEEEEGQTIVLFSSNLIPFNQFVCGLDRVRGSLEKIKVDLREGKVTRMPMSNLNLEFGVINPLFVGKKTNKFAFMGICDPIPKVSGVVKLELRTGCVVGRRDYPPGCFGGEPFFVANSGDGGCCPHEGEEDDGYVMTYLHDENRRESSFVIMDAKSSELDIVAEVILPTRVPYGFHGIFVGESDLRQMDKPGRDKKVGSLHNW